MRMLLLVPLLGCVLMLPSVSKVIWLESDYVSRLTLLVLRLVFEF